MDESLVKYRNLVMCPGHLLEKWERRRTPDSICKGNDHNDFSSCWRLESESEGWKRILYLSKDFAKLSYSLKPVQKKEIAKMAYMKKCRNPDCGVENMPVRKCVSCGGKDFEKADN